MNTNTGNFLRKTLLYLSLVGSGAASGAVIDQVITSQRISGLEQRVDEKLKTKAELGKFTVAEMYRGPDNNEFYIIRLGANPDEKVTPEEKEIYEISLMLTYFPSSFPTYFPSYFNKKSDEKQGQ